MVYPGLTTLELIGTVSVLDGLGLETGLQPVTVGKSRDPVSPDTPLLLIPQATFEEVPRPFGPLVPGGGPNAVAAMGDERLLHYVRAAAEGAELVASVGTGALILGAAGLLEGRKAISPPAYRGILENLGATYHRKRWVEDGRFITSAGVSAGIDMGLQLAARLADKATAREVQRALDYDPHPPFGGLDYGQIRLPLRARRAAARRRLASSSSSRTSIHP